jgi:hypothetical protein
MTPSSTTVASGLFDPCESSHTSPNLLQLGLNPCLFYSSLGLCFSRETRARSSCRRAASRRRFNSSNSSSPSPSLCGLRSLMFYSLYLLCGRSLLVLKYVHGFVRTTPSFLCSLAVSLELLPCGITNVRVAALLVESGSLQGVYLLRPSSWSFGQFEGLEVLVARERKAGISVVAIERCRM